MLIQQTPPDGGMLYAETNLDHFFPEPYNAITSCFFLFIAIYWTVKLWGKGNTHTFLSVALLLLYVGGIGGIIYHGLRQWWFFIMMDWLPIALLCISAGIYFLYRITKQWYFAILLIVVYIGFQVYARNGIIHSGNLQLFININYAVLAGIVLLPLIFNLIKTRFLNGKWVVYALIAFIFALTFRISDNWEWLEQGTHFLWHTFGAVAAFCMFQYIYLLNEKTDNITTHYPKTDSQLQD